jgi:hypothetical protein
MTDDLAQIKSSEQALECIYQPYHTSFGTKPPPFQSLLDAFESKNHMYSGGEPVASTPDGQILYRKNCARKTTGSTYAKCELLEEGRTGRSRMHDLVYEP